MTRLSTAGEIWLPASVSERVGRGVRLSSSTDLVAWQPLTGDAPRLFVRRPGERPFEPAHRVCSERGPCIDLGELVVDGQSVLPADPRRRRSVGHAVVERRGSSLRRLGGPLPALPEAAMESGARPWPVGTGWAWAWEDTLYRQSPEGRVTVAARTPGPIRAWDVGPRGSLWCVGAGCLWWAPPRRFARRVPDSVAAAAGVEVDTLEAGELLFSDDGQQAVIAELAGARPLRRGGLGPASETGTVGWRPDHRLVPQEERPWARACELGGWVLRLDEGTLRGWNVDGRTLERPVQLPSPPLDMHAHSHDGVTVLTAGGAVGLTLAGTRSAPKLDALMAPRPAVGVCGHGDQAIWWSADGGVVVGLREA